MYSKHKYNKNKISNNKVRVYSVVYKEMGARFAPYDIVQYIIIRGRGKN